MNEHILLEHAGKSTTSHDETFDLFIEFVMLKTDQIRWLSHANTHSHTSQQQTQRPSSRHQHGELQPCNIWCLFTITSLVGDFLSRPRLSSGQHRQPTAPPHIPLWPICNRGVRVEPIVWTNKSCDPLMSKLPIRVSAWSKPNVGRGHPFRLNSGTPRT